MLKNCQKSWISNIPECHLQHQRQEKQYIPAIEKKNTLGWAREQGYTNAEQNTKLTDKNEDANDFQK